MLVEVALSLFVVFLLIYWQITKHYGFFNKMGIPESPGYFPFGSVETWKVGVGNGDAFNLLDDPGGKFFNEKFYGFYIFGQKNLVVKEGIVKVKEKF